MKKILGLVFFLIAFFFPGLTLAASNSFVSVVNPIRGYDFWELKNQKIEEAVLGQAQILKQFKLPATWLIRYDALSDNSLMNFLKQSTDEKGLFLEITPAWTKDSDVSYNQSAFWHSAASALLTGYKTEDREKLLDTAFEKFKQEFGYFPKSVGAWWIDSFSLGYINKKYGISGALIVADQYTTDNYQIWGQYFSTPFYPAKNNALHPAGSLENKLPVMMTQWAARDPVNGYGKGVEESTYSVQANDYLDYHQLDTNYFAKLVDIYTIQPLNQVSHLVVGLENSYAWQKYKDEYQNQIETLTKKQSEGQFSIVSLSNFSNWYLKAFPNLSPQQVVFADDPLGSFKKAVWFMNSNFRAGFFVNEDGAVFRDIRQYIDGEEELCFKSRCDSVNFATFATRVLDEVSFGHKLILDPGKISNLKVERSGRKVILSYKNEAGKETTATFLQRDIKIGEVTSSIDSLILNSTKYQLEKGEEKETLEKGTFEWSFKSVLFEIIKFLLFLLIGVLIPGWWLVNKILNKEDSFLQKAAVSIPLGFSILTFLYYFLSLIKLRQFIFVYLLINLLLALRNELPRSKLRGIPSGKFFFKPSSPQQSCEVFWFKNKIKPFDISLKMKFRLNIPAAVLIVGGTIFQQLPTFKNGLIFPYGMGFWGPNTHDGVWHISLINELVKSVPPQNPIFAGTILKNYHYFYDLLVAATIYLTGIPALDLVFRFYPIVFSVTLGIGSYYLIRNLFKDRLNSRQLNLAGLIGLYLIYFAGSFGWIVEYITQRHFGGESAFWANQSISFNLNPPFAISLNIVIAILLLLPKLNRKNALLIVVLAFLSGSLIAFKAYAGILIILSLFLTALFRKSLSYLIIFIFGSVLSAILFISNFSVGEKLVVFSPFWFIHSMIDSPDRVGWTRLSLMRVTGLENGNWFKFIFAETASLLIFLLGNLGTRFFALLSVLKIKTIFSKSEYLFLFFFSLLSFLIPLLFIQSGNPWNTIQFLYYFMYVCALTSGIVIAQFIKINKVFVLIIVATVILTPINSWTSGSGYLSYQPHARISKTELQALDFLKSQPEGVVLTYPYDGRLKQRLQEPWIIEIYDSTAYVSALSQKSVFLEDEGQNQILLTDYKKRIVLSKDFFNTQVEGGQKFLKEWQIKYIYLPKIYNISLDSQKNSLKNIFENKEVTIYGVGN